MGAGTSKPTKAAGQVARRYPTRAAPSTRTTPLSPSPTGPPTPARPLPQEPPQSTFHRTDGHLSDAHDPAFASRLQKLGIVAPNPFVPLSLHGSTAAAAAAGAHGASSSSSSSAGQQQQARPVRENASLHVFRRREALQKQYEEEQDGIGRRGFAGRRFLDVGTVREVVRLRGTGVGDGEIEGRMGLARGVAARTGPRGAVSVVDL